MLYDHVDNKAEMNHDACATLNPVSLAHIVSTSEPNISSCRSDTSNETISTPLYASSQSLIEPSSTTSSSTAPPEFPLSSMVHHYNQTPPPLSVVSQCSGRTTRLATASNSSVFFNDLLSYPQSAAVTNYFKRSFLASATMCERCKGFPIYHDHLHIDPSSLPIKREIFLEHSTWLCLYCLYLFAVAVIEGELNHWSDTLDKELLAYYEDFYSPEEYDHLHILKYARRYDMDIQVPENDNEDQQEVGQRYTEEQMASALKKKQMKEVKKQKKRAKKTKNRN